jgi:hypothetical protein
MSTIAGVNPPPTTARPLTSTSTTADDADHRR